MPDGGFVLTDDFTTLDLAAQLAAPRLTDGRWRTIDALVCHLLRAGVEPDMVTELVLAWNRMHCDPPLAAERVRALIGAYTTEWDGITVLEEMAAEAGHGK